MTWYLALHVLVLVGIFRDAAQRGYNAWLAVLVLFFLPTPLGLFAYLWARPPLLRSPEGDLEPLLPPSSGPHD